MLKRSNMVESTSGTTALSLQARAGESLIVKDIDFYLAAAAAENVSVSIDRKKIMQFKAPSGWFLLGHNEPTGYHSIYKRLNDMELLASIPVAEGETLTITAPGANCYMSVKYDVYDAQDVKNTGKNGSKGETYDLLQVISNAGVRATAGDLELNQSDLDSLFPAFPGGVVVPSKVEMSLKALFGVAVTKGTGAANGEHTTKLKLLEDREDILDEDLTGIDFLGDATHTAATTVYKTIVSRVSAGLQYQKPNIFVFDEPKVFLPGSELNVYATLGRTGAGADFVAAEVKVGLLFEVRGL